ncbi:ABC transporter ATP-binding protein/permease [Staphylococcus felis]|uniref:ABC transporter ATP-binding protein/permease n=1 Tax=Staphylococcus felis TaxID=46127 RepID=A0AAX1RUI8_9STAP|nr:ABC transporter ATP-binding protein/permease [Staphylococcus felis]MBH9580783.1 ABC transporter ATP-binding protein/permease [Staphylococcus felis]MDM8327031.1 ABC transporter ATP-binding protein/permease [Staphylococcus felis]MDQ7192540.1 ABC transporter ATP-binding protein/permease [Staphylococcus felis]REH79849.1 ABC transporter ATP-binding protein/permease [Staphylococcus felis]REH85984.1 ABC transporter ATP-binding protein/permease [Staphylococcus felis]
MKHLYKWMGQFYIYPIFMAVICIALAVSVITQNIMIGTILDRLLFDQHSDWLGLILILCVALLMRATFTFLNDLMGERLSHRVRTKIRHLLLTQRNKEHVAARLTTATHTLSEMLPFYRVYLPQVFKSMMIPLAIIVTMWFVHIPTALIMMITAPFIPIFYIIFGLKTRDDARDQMTFLNQFSQRFLNLTKGLVTLKIFNRTHEAVETVHRESTTFRDKTMTILKSAFLSSLMLEFISMLGIGIVALEVGLSLIVFKSINFKVAAIAVIMAPEFYNAIKDLGQAFHTGKESEGASQVIDEALQLPRYDIQRPMTQTNQLSLIRVNDVRYSYSESREWQLQDIHLDIYEGDHIALVGPSGAGKSTLVQLILGELTPNSGTVTYSTAHLRTGYLSQHPYIFNATIAENITMFHDIDETIIYKALEEVRLMHLIDQLKNGIDTYIGEGGEALSGGEMRRLELARLLIMNPDFLVLDEPFTGLDMETETVIRDTLTTHFIDTTRLTVAHRQQTIQNATRRIYLKEGRIDADDTKISVDLRPES